FQNPFRGLNVAAPTTLIDELQSLRIQREPSRRALGRTGIVIAAAAAVLAPLVAGWRFLVASALLPEVETAAVVLVSPAQSAQLLVATGYVVPQRQAILAPRTGGRVAKLFVDDGSLVEAGQV